MTGTAGSRSRLSLLRSASVGSLDEGILRADESLEAVASHLLEGLEALCAQAQAGDLPQHETGLTQHLILELERRVGYRPYFFHPEFLENPNSGQSPRVDIAVNAKDDHPTFLSGLLRNGRRFFAIEAKRLPTPGAGREREYLTGRRGAMERYKRGVHGKDLRSVGIVGYVQENEFPFWRDTINRWIDELCATSTAIALWDEDDKLQLESASAHSAQLRSLSIRQPDGVRVVIRHFWVMLRHPAPAPPPRRRRRGDLAPQR